MKRTVKCPHCGYWQKMTKLVDCGTFWTKTCSSCGKGFVVAKEPS